MAKYGYKFTIPENYTRLPHEDLINKHGLKLLFRWRYFAIFCSLVRFEEQGAFRESGRYLIVLSGLRKVQLYKLKKE